MQNRRLRDWRIANSSDCNGDKYIRCGEREVKHRLQSVVLPAYVSPRMYLLRIINIIIVMSMVENAASAFYTSRVYTSEATALHMLTSTIEQRCFMLSESRLSRQRAGEEPKRRETHRKICALGWIKKRIFPTEFLFSHRAVLGHLEIRRLHQQWAVMLGTMIISLPRLFSRSFQNIFFKLNNIYKRYVYLFIK